MHVINRAEVVGDLTNERPDMEYLEGRFTPVDSPSGRRFAAAAAVLEGRNVLEDPSRGIRALLRDGPSDPGTTFIVMSLEGGRLFGRRVFRPEAVAWTDANVRE